MATAAASWADDVDEFELPKLPKPKQTIDENGIITIEEIVINDDGKKVKVTKKIRKKIQKAVVEHAVAERRQWAKFGKEKGSSPGPQVATTTIERENVILKLTAGNKDVDNEPSEEQIIKDNLKKSGAGQLKCRLCSGGHYTAKCPYKNELAGLDAMGEKAGGEDDFGAAGDEGAPTAGASTIGGKYVPPSMRAGARGAGESMRRPGGIGRDDLPTLRVSNLSQDATDSDVRDLFSRFGRVERVYIGRDRDTRIGKGFAFVSFEDRNVADQARQKVDGLGYDNLILKCVWSQPKE
ncbi:translation initiation factor eIF3g [Schizopora paradoxa]|uniref:Eukaryotic translation initiation factor 3 subunit G n=1 Tax=Schizopora paradoxa TaxID=27342 RepID=A0A0H2RX05_9AGAM|nr:translation initiation factor eIF3g [Schizopora paradoxa]